ncbi:MAG TPA: glutamate synthase large subunit [Candidatus Limnocylindria bacterium]|nr:glutamate synthase large subunit [Candidatus Limnocylindria bacterium]
MNNYPLVPESLYRPEFEHDACGVGFVANINGKIEHRIVAFAIEALNSLSHRGALDADAKTGDGAGILTQLPKALFKREAEKLGVQAVEEDDLAVGFVFMPRGQKYLIAKCQKLVEEGCARYGIHFLGWRQVPVNSRCLGDKARDTMPEIQQAILAKEHSWSVEEYERKLFLARNHAEREAALEKIDGFYIPSMSCRTIVYKGLFNAPQLPKFYPDLKDPLFVSALAIFHQRYSTNTFPNWQLAHPFRMLAHNGEINTLLGNKNWTRARERELKSSLWGDDIETLKPIIQPGGSDSSALDNAMEALQLSGRDVLHAAMMLAPEAWENMTDINPDLKGFYEYHACLNEPWDGPAAVVFSDGTLIGATLDRNGLRPARYKIYDDGLIVMGSEVGVVALDERKVVRKGRLGPGKLIAIDTERGVFMDNDEVKSLVASGQPYAQWCRENLYHLTPNAKAIGASQSPVNVLDLTLNQITFGWDMEQVDDLLKPMATQAAEPIGSMGDDTPFAVISKRPRLLYDYFKQLFAQVTNPPIDSIREKIVMSLSTTMGARKSWFEETPGHAAQVKVDSPFLFDYELNALKSIPAFPSEVIPCFFDISAGTDGLEAALNTICAQASAAVDAGKQILILTDRGVDAAHVPIPLLLATGAIHHHLIREGKRMRCSLVCESGEARDVHHFAALIGFGASVVNPYVAIDSVREAVESGKFGELTVEKAVTNFRKAIENGMLKVMSKMGISTIASYRGAQIFEAIGIGQEVIDRCFFGTVSQIGGISLKHIAEDATRRHQQAYGSPEQPMLDVGGNYRVAKGGRGEFHAFNPQVVGTLHKFIRSGKREEFIKYMETVEKREPVSPRDLLQLKPGTTPVPIDEVEPIEDIRRRFTTAGMSLGALSPETHECLAIAMNSIGGKSNSGEGGEDPVRYSTEKNSAIKQVASGRFGVTPAYLASAQEIEIKMAQGAKPGEGGQLPGHKVTPLIAQLRHSVPGVPLISPPPHHDIYSIEDLSQLIYDLKQVNPRAKVCVKLVACAGVGTVAAGVAKAYADVVLISGHDGGTGASPLSSIKNTGGPWEFGVAEAQQTLMLNDLRSRIVVRTDGGMKTGRDIIMAALLGAEEYNFGTAALVAAGCAMFRVCHLNTCPVGVATQKEELRLKFRGKPDNLVAFFNGVAQEVREILAQLGFRKLDDIIGHTDLLERRPVSDLPEELRVKAATLQIEKLLYQVDPSGIATRIHTRERNERFGDSSLDDRIMTDARVALQGNGVAKLSYKINNTHRNIGTRVSGHIGYTYGDHGLPDDSALDITLRGSAGQSFGCFLAKSVRLKLIGEANDYVGKGMSGGEIVIRPTDGLKYVWADNSIIGNVCIYGATGGRLFAAGRAGERFAVRNSGGIAVVEGVGDHGCEYMTGGIVVVLGETGRNFGAGMSGGRAYVYDASGTFSKRYNSAMVGIERLTHDDEAKKIESLIFAHLEATDSPRASEILKSWATNRGHFWVVVPHPAEAKPAGQPVNEPEKRTSSSSDTTTVSAPKGSF